MKRPGDGILISQVWIQTDIHVDMTLWHHSVRIKISHRMIQTKWSFCVFTPMLTHCLHLCLYHVYTKFKAMFTTILQPVYTYVCSTFTPMFTPFVHNMYTYTYTMFTYVYVYAMFTPMFTLMCTPGKHLCLHNMYTYIYTMFTQCLLLCLHNVLHLC